MSLTAADIAAPVAGRGADPILSVRDAWLQFGGLQAVAGASLEVARGSLTALIGPNGAGKTTLFNVITGFYRGDRGAIDYDGHAIFGRQPYDIARLGLVRTFQITKVLSAMPVIDNMMLAAPRQPGESLVQLAIRPAAARRREREIRERALVLLQLFDLHRQAADYAGTLSGGQRKLLELARALMAEPRLVLLDEPMAGVNATLGRRLLEHVEMLRAQRRHHLPVHRARHGRGDAPRRPCRRHGARPGDRRRHARSGAPRPARARRLSRHREVGPAVMAPPQHLLAAEGLVAGYLPEVDILNGVDLAIDAGEIVTVLGPNGAGKSTLAKTIFGLLRPRQGSVTLRGAPITGLKPSQITRRGVGYVPQLANVFPSMTVQENLELGLTPRGAGDARERFAAMYALFPRLAERRRQVTGTMSGGERQMVAMARALMPEPDVLLLDEPSAGLAPIFVDAMFEQIARVNAVGVDHPDGRAERPPGAGDVAPRLRPRARPEPLPGRRPGAARRSTRRRALSRRRGAELAAGLRLSRARRA